LAGLLSFGKAAAPAAVGAGLLASPEEAEAGFLSATTKGIKGASEVAPKATKANLQRARKMSSEGIDPRFIYEQTGYFRGADGKMRYEVPDPESIDFDAAKGETLLRNVSGILGDGGYQKTTDISRAIDQYPAADLMFGGSYPEIRTEGMEDFGGYYSPTDRSIALNETLSDDNLSSVLAHELQHAVQARKGFATGANPNSVKKQIDQGLLKAQQPLGKANLSYDLAIQNLRSLSGIAAASKYRKYSLDSNLTGKRRLLVNNSSWNQYGDKIRQELGPEPKRHRPKAEREQWLSQAWAKLADFVDPLDEVAYAKLYDISKTPRGEVGDYISEGTMYLYKKDDSYPTSISERANLAREQLLSDPKLADKQIRRIETHLDSIRDDAAEYSRLRNLRNEVGGERDYQLYKRSAGEVEARNVQSRLGMSQDERYESYPLDTEDVPRTEQILNKSPSQKAQRGFATPLSIASTAGAGLLGNAAVQRFNEGVLGGADFLANAGSAVAEPFITAAQTLRALPTNTPTSEIEAQRAAYQNSLDYQPRTEIGRNATEGALGLLGGALQGPMAAGKAIAEPLTPIYDAAAEQYKRLPRRVQLGAESLLDLF